MPGDGDDAGGGEGRVATPPPPAAAAAAPVLEASKGKCRNATCQTLASVCVRSVMVERNKSINTPLVVTTVLVDRASRRMGKKMH